MNDRWTLRAVEHHELEQVANPVRAQNQVTGRILADLLNDEGTRQITARRIRYAVPRPQCATRLCCPPPLSHIKQSWTVSILGG